MWNKEENAKSFRDQGIIPPPPPLPSPHPHENLHGTPISIEDVFATKVHHHIYIFQTIKQNS